MLRQVSLERTVRVLLLYKVTSVEIHFKSALSKQETKKKKSKYNGKVQSEVVGEIVKLRDVDMYIEG